MSAPWAQGSLLPMLDVLDPALPRTLIPMKARRRLRSAGADLPFVANIGLECRLGAAPRRVDLLLGDPGPAALGRLLAGTPLGRTLRMQREPGSPLDRWVDMTLLEFDLDDHTVAPPALFLSLRPTAVIDGPALVQLASCLVGRVPDALASLLQRCAEAVGREAEVTHVGVMASRPDRGVRINIGAVSAAVLLQYATTIGMPADQQAAAAALLDAVAPFVHHLVLALDLADGLLPRFGVECYLAAPPECGNHWRLFLTQLGTAGLCRPNEATALLQWPGQTPTPAANEWPPQRRRIGDFLGPSYRSVVVRTLNHIKLVSMPGAPVQAKVYLLARHLWLNGDG